MVPFVSKKARFWSKASFIKIFFSWFFCINSNGFEVLYVHKTNHNFNKNQVFLQIFEIFTQNLTVKLLLKFLIYPCFPHSFSRSMSANMHRWRLLARVSINEWCSHRFWARLSRCFAWVNFRGWVGRWIWWWRKLLLVKPGDGRGSWQGSSGVHSCVHGLGRR